jgi:putative transposase
VYDDLSGDNAVKENFFLLLKIECTVSKHIGHATKAKADVFEYIECFYDVKRRQSTIGYLSPMELENRTKLA